jgi:CheY-like chemotaxis protein
MISVATILYVDDEPAETLSQLLHARGYRVLSATNGPSAIALSRHYDLDLVILDYHMPGMDGEQVAHMLTKEHPGLPIVMWTGCPDAVPEGLKWFVDAFLEKGNGPLSLLSTVEKLISCRSISTGLSVSMRQSYYSQ